MAVRLMPSSAAARGTVNSSGNSSKELVLNGNSPPLPDVEPADPRIAGDDLNTHSQGNQ